MNIFPKNKTSQNTMFNDIQMIAYYVYLTSRWHATMGNYDAS